jgi:hypothetical protein
LTKRIGERFGAFSERSRLRSAPTLFLAEQQLRKLCAMISASEGSTNCQFSLLSAASKAESVMTTWLPTGSRNLVTEDDERSAKQRSGRSVLQRLKEVLSICARARAAAHHYEELKPLSGADLAEKGLTRDDVSRAAFRKLTGEP